MKGVVKFLVLAAIVLLGYVCVTSITDPIQFKSTKEKREKQIEKRLIEIRKAQIEYKNLHKVHAKTFDELRRFLREDKLPTIIKEGVLTDKQLESGMTEAQAAKKGLIRRDTIWVVAVDTIFGKGYQIDSIGLVPGTNIPFTMDTATIVSSSGYPVRVFECGVKYEDYLKDLNQRMVRNLIHKSEKLDRYPGLRVGSLEEVNNYAGNWE